MVVAVPQTRYARSGDRHVAYQVLGDGPIDLLSLSDGTTISIDARDDEPHWRRFDRRLASFSRLIRFDPSGLGLSDPLAAGTPPTLELWMQDAVAVLDAVGSSRAALLGTATGGLVAMLVSATYPQRTSAQVLMHCFARAAYAPDYPCGYPPDVLDRFMTAVTDPDQAAAVPWAAGPDRREETVDDVALVAPTLAADDEFRSWWQQAGHRGASPSTARDILALGIRADIRAVLPMIATPILVLHRRDNAFVPVGLGRFLAETIAGAKLIELPGRDHLPFVGDTDDVLDEIEEFVTGSRGAPSAERTLATILFTDIAGSTELASAAGDRRWRDLLDDHDRMAERQVHRFGGRQVKTTGDGILAVFDGPARAIQCALALRDGARQLGLDLRVGLHAGEVERRGDDVGGIAVHIAARVQGHAQPGEVWVSRTVADLVTGSGIAFHDQGEHELKGIRSTWQLLSVGD